MATSTTLVDEGFEPCEGADYSLAPTAKELSRLVEGLNINPRTYLATDYINHFGEFIMLLDLLPDMPDLMDDLRDWQPKSYEQHFHDSGFLQSDIYILAYEQSRPEFRGPFDNTVVSLNQAIADSLPEIERVMERNSPEEISQKLKSTASTLQSLCNLLTWIANNGEDSGPQSAVDALFD